MAIPLSLLSEITKKTKLINLVLIMTLRETIMIVKKNLLTLNGCLGVLPPLPVPALPFIALRSTLITPSLVS